MLLCLGMGDETGEAPITAMLHGNWSRKRPNESSHPITTHMRVSLKADKNSLDRVDSHNPISGISP
jgi:hypothetical protein